MKIYNVTEKQKNQNYNTTTKNNETGKYKVQFWKFMANKIHLGST